MARGTACAARVAPGPQPTPLLFDPNMRTPFVNQWNISIQRQVLRDTVLEVAYVGNKGTHMFRMMNANQANISADFIAGFKASRAFVRSGRQAARHLRHSAAIEHADAAHQ
jgi:hypothetical protein